MTPVTGWNEHDYYRASRAARQAWQNTNQQLDIAGLEERDAAPWEAELGDSAVPSRSSNPVMSPPDGRDNRRRHPSSPGSINGGQSGPSDTAPLGEQGDLGRKAVVAIPPFVTAATGLGVDVPVACPPSQSTTGPDRLSPEDDGQAQRRSR